MYLPKTIDFLKNSLYNNTIAFCYHNKLKRGRSMKQWKKTIAGLTACTMLLTGGMAFMPESAVDFEIMVSAAEEYTKGTYESLTYANYGDHIVITGCDETVAELVIPAEIEGAAVTAIGANAFYNNDKLTSVTIPETVTTIGEKTFYSCSSLTSVNIPGSVTTIGGNAFSKCSLLTEVTLNEGLKQLGYNAFSETGITEIHIPLSLTS
ncbi:MAG: leucine-rich repeat domain-containing protein, partial [Ruminococcus sp.]|nr:leucine-rich repeat domain-containing protein [Ruminococcus sp.]